MRVSEPDDDYSGAGFADPAMGGITGDTRGRTACLYPSGQANLRQIGDTPSVPKSIRAAACFTCPGAVQVRSPGHSPGTTAADAEGASASGVSLGIEAPGGIQAAVEITSYLPVRRRSVPVSRVSVLPESWAASGPPSCGNQ